MTEFDNNRLRGLIKEHFGSESVFCEKLKMAPSTLSSKLNNKSDFSRMEMLGIIKLLCIEKEEIFDIFFKV